MATITIQEKAEQHVHSYAKALAAAPSQGTEKTAEALHSHWAQKNFVAFTHGHTSLNNSTDADRLGTKRYLDKFIEAGIGLDIRLASHRIEVVSSGSAICFMTWAIYPPETAVVQGWEWVNVYMFRLLPGQDKGCWEAVISDNEIGGLLQRFPKFMDGLF